MALDGAPRQERRWGEGVTERCGDNKRLLKGGGVGWRNKSRKIQKRLIQVGREVYNKVLSIATEPRFQREMSEVETQTPHNLDILHGPVDGYTHTNFVR